jgi:putative membrane protein
MTREEHARIAAAVRAAEERTAGEIYCVVARASDSYLFPAAFFVTTAIVALSLVVTWALHHWWFDVRPVTLVLAQILAIACALLVLWFFPAIRIRLVPKRLQYRRAHDNAVKQFLARNVHITTARTGVLLFVSLAERYAEVVADAGINQRVEQAAWNGVVATLVDHARRGKLPDGFVAAVETVGSLLERHFPIGGGDLNELDDHVVEL